MSDSIQHQDHMRQIVLKDKRIAQLEADKEEMLDGMERMDAQIAKLREALETVRDAGLEPIDPAYRELARTALLEKNDEGVEEQFQAGLRDVERNLRENK